MQSQSSRYVVGINPEKLKFYGNQSQSNMDYQDNSAIEDGDGTSHIGFPNNT